MNDGLTLLAIPNEILCHIGDFLKARDLLALSSTCRRLRSALNNNRVWHKHSREPLLRQCLERVTSIVSPNFTDSASDSDPSCLQKLNFLRKSRLVQNYRQGKFIEQSFHFKDSQIIRTQIQYKKSSDDIINFHRVTYNNEYFFSAADRSKNHHSVVQVSNISKYPRVVTSFKPKHLAFCSQAIDYLKVVGSLLIVGVNSWIDIYEIKLPSRSFPLRHSIKAGRTFCIGGNFLFNEDTSSNAVLVWDLKSGTKVDTIPSKFGLCFQIKSFSERHQKVMLSFGLDSVSEDEEDAIVPHLYLYDVESLQLTSFDAVIDRDIYQPDCYLVGLIDDSYVVIVIQLCNESLVTATVYNINTSAVVAQRPIINVDVLQRCPPVIIDGCLIMPTLFSIKILSLNNSLCTSYTLDIECGGLIPEIPTYVIHSVTYIALSNHCYFIVVSKSDGCTEIWDYKTKQKCFQLPDSFMIGISDSLTKLLFLQRVYYNNYLKILNFW